MCCFTVFYAKEGGKLGFEDAIDKLELLQPQFVMSVGDLIDGKINDSILLDEQWNEFNSEYKNSSRLRSNSLSINDEVEASYNL